MTSAGIFWCALDDKGHCGGCSENARKSLNIRFCESAAVAVGLRLEMYNFSSSSSKYFYCLVLLIFLVYALVRKTAVIYNKL